MNTNTAPSTILIFLKPRDSASSSPRSFFCYVIIFSHTHFIPFILLARPIFILCSFSPYVRFDNSIFAYSNSSLPNLSTYLQTFFNSQYEDRPINYDHPCPRQQRHRSAQPRRENPFRPSVCLPRPTIGCTCCFCTSWRIHRRSSQRCSYHHCRRCRQLR